MRWASLLFSGQIPPFAQHRESLISGTGALTSPQRRPPIVQSQRRLVLIVGLCLFVAIAVIAGSLYLASQQTPPFYAQALAQDPATARHASDVMLRQTAALVSDLRRAGQWQAIYTAEQINGWLAYDVQRNHPHLFPSGISEPRIAFGNDHLQIAFRWQKPGWSAIVSLEAELYLQEVNVVALRIRTARAGKLPLPLGSLLNDVAASGRELGLAVDQQQIEGDPLLLITLPSVSNDTGKQLSLESLELHDGELYVAGRSQREGEAVPPLARKTDRNQSVSPEAQVEKLNLQR